MKVFYNQALNLRNEFMFLIGESFTMNNEKFNIKDITIVPSDLSKQDEFFKDQNILPFITEKCDLVVILTNEHYKDHYPYLTLESLLKLHKFDFKLEDYLDASYSV